MTNFINLHKYKSLLNSYYWDCPKCGKTNKESINICKCGHNANTEPLYKKVPREILKICNQTY